MEISTTFLSSTFIHDLYARMLLTRLVDDCAWKLQEQAVNGLIATCRGHEAVQVGSAVCIEIGTDFTLPYYRDLGVVLTIGMTPYEVLRTYIQAQVKPVAEQNDFEHSKNTRAKNAQMIPHWGYHKHNIISGTAPIATQVLHAAGIAFACKLRKAAAVTIAYCGDDATSQPDFLAGITFAAQHRLPAVFVYEQDNPSSSLQTLSLPAGLEYVCINGTDVIAVYSAMRAAMQHAREGHGPVLLEMKVRRSRPGVLSPDEQWRDDPLVCCQRYLEERGMWDEEWIAQLRARCASEVEQAMKDALQDGLQNATALSNKNTLRS